MTAFMLLEAFVIVGRIAAAGEDCPQVAQHEVGAHDARFPEVGASGRRLATVVVVDLTVAYNRDIGEFRVLGRHLLSLSCRTCEVLKISCFVIIISCLKLLPKFLDIVLQSE